MKAFGEDATQNKETEIFAIPHKEDLLSGMIPPKRFLDDILYRDQQDPKRTASEDNLALLLDPEVAAFFEADAPQFYEHYRSVTSLSAFHVGQRVAVAGTLKALGYFEIALQFSSEEEPEWVLYVRGTIAYLNNDLQGLKAIHASIEDGLNKEVLARFIDGLETRGIADYASDYLN